MRQSMAEGTYSLRARRQRQREDCWVEDWEGEDSGEEPAAGEEGSSPSPPPRKKQRGQAR